MHDYDIKPDMTTKKFVEMTPIDQWIAIGKAHADTQGGMDAFYVADIFDAKLSEVGRLALISECIQEDDGILWASCQDDIDKIDYARLFDQLRADANHGGDIRQKIRMLAYLLPAQLKEHAEKVAKLKAEDPAWKKAFEIAASSRTEWATLAAKNAKYLALTSEMESAFVAKSRSMFEGCDDKTYAALGEAMSTVPAKTFAKIHDIRDDPSGGFAYKALPIAMKNPAANIAAIGVVLCNQRVGTARALGGALGSTPSLRGPHNFAISKMADASLQLDDMSKKISWPRMRHPYSGQINLWSAGANIKSVKKEGDHLIVESAPMMVTRRIACRSTSASTSSASVMMATSTTNESATRPRWSSTTSRGLRSEIDTRYEKLLKPGLVFSASDGDKDADVIAIWSGPNATAPSLGCSEARSSESAR